MFDRRCLLIFPFIIYGAFLEAGFHVVHADVKNIMFALMLALNSCSSCLYLLSYGITGKPTTPGLISPFYDDSFEIPNRNILG